MKYLVVISFLVLLSSCKKDELGPQYLNEGSSGNGGELLVLNEGNFGWSNGSMSILYVDSVEVENQVFLEANDYAIGDVVQSAKMINGDLFVVVNNSGKIEVLDTASMESKHSISGLNSPRYLTQISSSKAYVSDLYSNSIQIIDLSSFQVIGSIAVSGWTESMQLFNGSVYVSMPESNQMLVIDPVTDQITNTIKLRKGAGTILEASNGDGWVLCSGGINEDIPALYKLDLSSNSKLDSLEFSSVSQSPGNLQMNHGGDSLFYINSHVYGMSMNDASLPSSPIFTSNNQVFYSLYADPIDKWLYVSDVKDYIQNSTIYKMNYNGVVLNTYETGVISGDMLRLK